MYPILKNILAVLAAIFIGGSVNMALIMVSGSIIPPPEGADLTTEEGLKAAMVLMEPKHFLFPFLAHALGTLVGALIVGFFAASHKLYLAMIIATLFFIGGFYMVMILPSPLWFNLTDLILAYFPMAFLGVKLTSKRQNKEL